MDRATFGRLVQESGDVAVRTHALNSFIGSTEHLALAVLEKELLDKQLCLMIDYGAVLRERIELERCSE